jgi:hypothetical protein
VDRRRTNLIGLSLIIGAAVGFALGLILAEPAGAAVFGAAGAGIGIVVGAAIASLDRGDARRP